MTIHASYTVYATMFRTQPIAKLKKLALEAFSISKSQTYLEML